MGLTGELMKSVFSKGRPDMNGGRCGFRFRERRKWDGVSSYLRGDEFGLVPAEDSVFLQPLPGKFTKEEEMQITEVKAPREKQNSISQLFREQDAAIVIQTAFRSYMTRNQRKEETEKEEDNKLLLLPIGRDGSPNVKSTNTSLEDHSAYSVQLLSGSPAKGPSGGESVETPSEILVQGQSLQQDRMMVYPQERKPRIRVLRAKEEWDDSTVSCNVAEMRIKRRLEAVTRRERALAYAFSQQLRVCSRKRPEGEEPNTSWSWMKRWMATRPSENLSPLIPLDGTVGAIRFKQQCGKTRRKLLDLAGEEKEICGPNQVPLNMGIFTIGSKSHKKPNLAAGNESDDRKFRKPRKLPTRRYQKITSTERRREPKVSTSRHEEQLTRTSNTVAASVI